LSRPLHDTWRSSTTRYAFRSSSCRASSVSKRFQAGVALQRRVAVPPVALRRVRGVHGADRKAGAGLLVCVVSPFNSTLLAALRWACSIECVRLTLDLQQLWAKGDQTRVSELGVSNASGRRASASTLRAHSTRRRRSLFSTQFNIGVMTPACEARSCAARHAPTLFGNRKTDGRARVLEIIEAQQQRIAVQLRPVKTAPAQLNENDENFVGHIEWTWTTLSRRRV
jgi:hypothetical protein